MVGSRRDAIHLKTSTFHTNRANSVHGCAFESQWALPLINPYIWSHGWTLAVPLFALGQCIACYPRESLTEMFPDNTIKAYYLT